MSKTKQTRYCWDSCAYLAWLCEEDGAPVDDMHAVIAEVEAGKALMILPVTVYTEVLTTKVRGKAGDFSLFIQNPNVRRAELTFAVAEKVRQVRQRGLAERPKRSLKTGDAQILATALLHKATILHSMDPHLLSLNGHETADRLRITKPCLLGGYRPLPGTLMPPVEDA